MKMPCQLIVDCLNEIFEYLEKDKITLYSCLLVNHLWCEVSVRILWRNIDNCNTKILDTLMACLPDESKDLLHENGVFISTPTPLFNYTSFCKALSVGQIARYFYERQQIFITYSNRDLIMEEIFKMLMNQTTLKKLAVWSLSGVKIPNFTQFPGAKDCLTGLSKLIFQNGCSKFCYQLSQICHNIQSINIEFVDMIPSGLLHLISSQNSLKSLKCLSNYESNLLGCLNTLIKLKINCRYGTRDFNLQHVTFPQLQILKIQGGALNAENLIKFLEINGKNLKELYVKLGDYSINLAIAKFCPNLKSLYSRFFYEGGLESLKRIFHSCEQLEKIEVASCIYDLTDKQIFEIVAKHSPKNFQELVLYSSRRPGFLSEDLESFFISWKDRIPQKPLTLIIVENFNSLDNENMRIIEKYKNMGTIKKFIVKRRK